MKAAAAERVREWVTRTCTLPRSDRELRAQVLEQLRDVIDFAYYVWLLTDPVTWVGTAPLASVPDLESLPLLIRLKYQAAPSRWTALPSDRCVALSAAVPTARGLGTGRACWRRTASPMWHHCPCETGTAPGASWISGAAVVPLPRSRGKRPNCSAPSPRR